MRCHDLCSFYSAENVELRNRDRERKTTLGNRERTADLEDCGQERNVLKEKSLPLHRAFWPVLDTNCTVRRANEGCTVRNLSEHHTKGDLLSLISFARHIDDCFTACAHIR